MRILATTFAAAALMLSAGAAQAATYELNFNGQINTAGTGAFDSGGFHIDFWNLGLSGLETLQETINVAQGDRIVATVQLDQNLTVPTSQILTSFAFYLGTFEDFPDGDVATSGEITFLLDGTPFKTGSGSTGTSGQIISGYTFFPPNNGAFTFDSFVVDFTIDQLSASTPLEFAGATYQLRSLAAPTDAVPEPAAWALMILGFGATGAAMRSRRRLGAGVEATART